jgi:hypothetical protein
MCVRLQRRPIRFEVHVRATQSALCRHDPKWRGCIAAKNDGQRARVERVGHRRAGISQTRAIVDILALVRRDAFREWARASPRSTTISQVGDSRAQSADA